MELDKIYNMDCLEGMKMIPDKSIDAIICDLPYGTTRNEWDSVIPFDALWKSYERVIKDNGAIALFAQQPFASQLVCSNPKMFKYEWIWVKDNATGFLNSGFTPLKKHENILIFSKASAAFVRNRAKAMTYIPQMSKGKAYTAFRGGPSSNYDVKHMRRTRGEYGAERFPTDVLKFNKVHKPVHPTQKPLELVRYLVRTYTNVGG